MDREPMWAKCRSIEENSLYNAQTHFEEARRRTVWSRWLLIGPSLLSFGAGTAVALGAPRPVGVLALVGGLIAGLAGALDISQNVYRHIQAGNAFTALRHDAETLRITFGPLKTDDELVAAIRELHDRYNTLVSSTDTTSQRAFETARARIHQGVFKSDDA